MEKIQKLANGTGLRTWATDKNLTQATTLLMREALKRNITPSTIAFATMDDYADSGLWQIILWGDHA